MFSRPKNGWVRVSIGQFEGRASYLTDVPLDCLNAVLTSLKNNVGLCIHFDEEGSEFTVVLDTLNVKVIVDKEDVSIVCTNMRLIDFATEIVKDIEGYFAEWCDWLSYEEQNKDRDTELRDKLEELKALLHIKLDCSEPVECLKCVNYTSSVYMVLDGETLCNSWCCKSVDIPRVCETKKCRDYVKKTLKKML